MLYYQPAKNDITAFYQQATESSADIIYLRRASAPNGAEIKVSDWLALAREIAHAAATGGDLCAGATAGAVPS